MNDWFAALTVLICLMAYALALAWVNEEQVAFEDELLEDHER